MSARCKYTVQFVRFFVILLLRRHLKLHPLKYSEMCLPNKICSEKEWNEDTKWGRKIKREHKIQIVKIPRLNNKKCGALMQHHSECNGVSKRQYNKPNGIPQKWRRNQQTKIIPIKILSLKTFNIWLCCCCYVSVCMLNLFRLGFAHLQPLPSSSSSLSPSFTLDRSPFSHATTH